MALFVFIVIRALPRDRLPSLPCPFRAITHLPCVACGGSRALLAMVDLEARGALVMNPLVAMGALLAFAYILHAFGVVFFDRKPWTPELGTGTWGRILRIGVPLALALNWGYLIAAGR